jgi:hypothetical protein
MVLLLQFLRRKVCRFPKPTESKAIIKIEFIILVKAKLLILSKVLLEVKMDAGSLRHKIEKFSGTLVGALTTILKWLKESII